MSAYYANGPRDIKCNERLFIGGGCIFLYWGILLSGLMTDLLLRLLLRLAQFK